MDALSALLALVAIVLYLIAAGRVAQALAQRRVPARGPLLAVVIVALILHMMVLHNALIGPHGLRFGLSNIALMHGWLLALLAVMVTVYRPVQGIYLVAMPLAALELSIGVIGHDADTSALALTSAIEGHILVSLLAYSLLSIAALQAVLVHWQERALRRRQRGLLLALPALQTMESMLFELIAVGFVLLSLAIGSGFLVLDDLFAQHVAHKTLFTLMAWFVFACLLLGRHWRGWRGRTAVRFTLIGFALLLLGFVGSKFVLELLLAPMTS